MNKEEFYFDFQGLSGPTERLVELVAKISAGILLTLFSFNELAEEISEYRLLRKQKVGARG